ncbi:MAG: hypothetical protein ABSD47_14020 [Candidatus Methylomirabilota bacterium]|jgi:hypothetical protein
MFETDKSVHPSFWTPDPGGGGLRIKYPNESLPTEYIPLSDQPHFLHWRLRRLNKAYQKAVSELWEQRSEALAEFQPFAEDFPPNAGETFDQWRRRHHPLSVKYLEVLSAVADRNVDAATLWGTFGPPPIPFEVRFPCPGLLGFLPALPARHGPVPDWRVYLLSYDMALSGVNDAAIADALLGERKRRLDKDPRLVRLAKIKKEMKALVDESFQESR